MNRYFQVRWGHQGESGEGTFFIAFVWIVNRELVDLKLTKWTTGLKKIQIDWTENHKKYVQTYLIFWKDTYISNRNWNYAGHLYPNHITLTCPVQLNKASVQGLRALLELIKSIFSMIWISHHGETAIHPDCLINLHQNSIDLWAEELSDFSRNVFKQTLFNIGTT